QALALGARIDRLFGRVQPSQRVVLDVRYAALGHGWHGLAMHRAALFELLHSAATAERIDITAGVDIERVEPHERHVTLIAKNDVRLGEYDLIVDALGAHSPLARNVVRRTPLPYGALWANVPWPTHLGLNPNALEQRYQRASRMAGLLPIGRLNSSS